MNPTQAKEFIKKYQGPNVRSYVKPSHLEELSQLLEVHIEALEVRKDEFHEMDGGKAYMPRKETLDKFAAAAGVSYNEAAESTRMEGEGCYVGRSQAMVMGPDGKMILGSACEYEFDVDTRTMEMEVNGKPDWNNKDQFGRPGKIAYSEMDLKKERINFRKVGRQRANTGARNRATVSILGMPTGIRGLFEKNDPPTATRTFLFSRIIVNAKNELVMNRMLDGIAGNAAALYGPKAISGPAPSAHQQAEPEMRPVGPGAGDDFDDDLPLEPAAPAGNPRVTEIITALSDWIASGNLAPETSRALQSHIDRGESDLAVLEPILGLTQLLGGRKIGQRANAATKEMLDSAKADPIILADLFKRVKAGAEKMAAGATAGGQS